MTRPTARGGGVAAAPAITVGIATVDRPAGLARCLDAILSADSLPAEVIVVEQGATSVSQDVVREFGGRSVPVVLVRQDRRGLSASRNAVAARASARIIAVTDDDCVPGPGWLSALERAFTAADAPAAVAGRVLPLGPPTPGTYEIASRASEIPADYAGRAVPWLVGTGGNFAVDLGWLTRVGGYDERLGTGSPGQAGEDTDLIYRLLRAGGRIRYEPAALVYHERHPAARRLATRKSYGFGVGAMCGLWLRRGDPYALSVAAEFVLLQARGIAGAVRARRRIDVRGHLLSLRGLAGGLTYGLGARARRADSGFAPRERRTRD